MITPLLDETLEAVHLVLKDAGLTATEIDEILLVGGSTRTPLVQQRLEREFGVAPRFEVDPDLCVASGAAMQAAMLQGQEVQAVLVDVTPYTFGVSAVGEIDGYFSPTMFVPLIKKNTPVPVTRSEVFYTAYDYQEVVEVKVYQGEAANALDNLEVGQFLVEGLVKCRSGSEIIATFALDSDGILQVSATEKATGLARSITIHNMLSDADQGSVADARDKIRRLFNEEEPEETALDEESDATTTSDSQGTVKNSSRVQAEALMDKARSLFDTASEDDREDMIDLIDEILSALAEGDETQLKERMEELSEIIFFLET